MDKAKDKITGLFEESKEEEDCGCGQDEQAQDYNPDDFEGGEDGSKG